MKLRTESSYSDQNPIRIMTCMLGLPSRTFSSPPMWSSGVVEGWVKKTSVILWWKKRDDIWDLDWVRDRSADRLTEKCFACYLQSHIPLFLFLLSFLSLPVVDPMGEEHYTRGAPWIPPFMVVVSPIQFLYFVCKLVLISDISIQTDLFLLSMLLYVVFIRHIVCKFFLRTCWNCWEKITSHPNIFNSAY